MVIAPEELDEIEAHAAGGDAAGSLDSEVVPAILLLLVRHYRTSQWRPIETAPKNEEILLINECGWQRVDFLPDRVPDGAPLYRSGWSDVNGAERYPTHWMPLPEPPKTST